MKKNQKSIIGQSIGDWLADEGFSPSKQTEVIYIIQRNEGRCLCLTDMVNNELKQLIQETLDSVASDEYTLVDLTGMND
jgi:hypothetical protein